MILDKWIKHFKKSCVGKAAYATESIARKRVKQLEKKYNVKHYIYYCPICCKYHATTHKMPGKEYLE